MPAVSFFDCIQSQIQAKMPFVVFSDFGKTSIKAIFQTNTKTYTSTDFIEKGFVFSPFDASLPTYLIPEKKSSKLHFSDLPIYTNKSKVTSVKSDSTAHKRLIQNAIDEINSSELDKVVLARTLALNFEKYDEVELFLSIAKAYPDAYTYFWYHPKTGFWLGASPETLLNIKGRKVKTMALAGTQAFKGSSQVNWDLKNHEEQEFVTEFLKKELSPHLNNLEVSVPKTIKAGNLLHLQTTLTGDMEFNSKALKNLISSIHPTPAVCGTPKPVAMSFIKNNESINRAYYSGFLGEIHMPNENQIPHTNLVVNLRCMQLERNRAILFAGGGITSKSDPDMEWNETEAKLNTIKAVLES